MKLTTEQKDLADELFKTRDGYILDRDHNRLEVEKIRLMIKDESDKMMRHEMKKSIVYGNDKIKELSRRIRGLSLREIAKKVGSSHNPIVYYERSSSIPRL